jgi:hypothetical protein
VVLVSSKITSSEVTSSNIIKAMGIVMVIVMTVMFMLYMNNFLLVMHFVDKMWDMHSDMYTAKEKKDK